MPYVANFGGKLTQLGKHKHVLHLDKIITVNPVCMFAVTETIIMQIIPQFHLITLNKYMNYVTCAVV